MNLSPENLQLLACCLREKLNQLGQHGGRIITSSIFHRIYTPLLDSAMASNRGSFI